MKQYPYGASMRNSAFVALVLAVLGLSGSAFAQAPGDVAHAGQQQAAAEAEFEVALLRTWTGNGLTMLDGLAQVPLAMMAGGTTGDYRFELTVFDSEGTELYHDSWERQLSDRAAAYTGTGASTLLEPFRFGIRPGVYEVEVRAYPTDAPDLGRVTRLSVEAYEEQPIASDLFLADRVEPLDADGGGSWSITNGGYGISAVAQTTVLPEDPRLFYYVEFYGADDPATVLELSGAVVDERNRVVYSTPPDTVQSTPGGMPLAGSLHLAGLPPGTYKLRLDLKVGDVATVRRADFRMLDPATRRVVSDSYESEYFSAISDKELEDTFGGVGYLVTESERQAFNSLPPDAKRRYLAEFFASRDPDPRTNGNAFLEEYLERVGTLRMQYGELIGTGERPPWTTDAGRVLLKYGEPPDRIINHYPSGADSRPVGGRLTMLGEVPYEIWRYHSTGYVYLFVQETQFGNWRMIFTTDRNMRSLADWQERVGQEALQDLRTRFGVQPRL